MSISAVLRMEAQSIMYPLISQAAIENPSSNINKNMNNSGCQSHSRISSQTDKFTPPHCLADEPFSASPIMDVLNLDEEFNEIEKAHFITFHRNCEQQMIPAHQPSEVPSHEHDTFFDAISRANIDLNAFPKEGLFIQALWVIYLSALKKVLTLKEYKYQTMEAFWSQYSNAFNSNDLTSSHAIHHHPVRPINAKESINLFHTANWMAIMFKIIPARKNKGFSINVVPKLVEGWNVKYITGSGQTAATIFRVVIFQTEGHVIPFHRGHHNKEGATSTSIGGDSKKAVPDALSKNRSNSNIDSNISSNNSSFTQRSSSTSTNILPTLHLYQSAVSPPSLSIGNLQLISSATIVGSDEDGRLNKRHRSSNEADSSYPTSCDGLSSEGESWEKNCGLFKKSDIVLEKHGNHGFKPVCSEKKEKPPKREQREISNNGSRSSSRSCVSNNSSSENFDKMLQFNSISPPFRDSFTDLMMDDGDYADPEQPGTLSRDVSEILKSTSEEESLTISLFDRDDLSLFDDISLPISIGSMSPWRGNDCGNTSQGNKVDSQVPVPALHNNNLDDIVKSRNSNKFNMTSGDNALGALMLFK